MQADKIAKAVGIEIRMPRQCGRLTQRPNYWSKTAEEYYCVAIFIPNLGFIIKSLEIRLATTRITALFSLHPTLMSQLDRNSF